MSYLVRMTRVSEVEMEGDTPEEAKQNLLEMYESGDSCAELGDATFEVIPMFYVTILAAYENTTPAVVGPFSNRLDALMWVKDEGRLRGSIDELVNPANATLPEDYGNYA